MKSLRNWGRSRLASIAPAAFLLVGGTPCRRDGSARASSYAAHHLDEFNVENGRGCVGSRQRGGKPRRTISPQRLSSLTIVSTTH